MTAPRAFPSIVKLLGTHLTGREAQIARVLDAAIGEARTVLDAGAWPEGMIARERLAACLWACGLYAAEADDEAFAWLVAKGFDVQGEIAPETLHEAEPVGPEPPPVPDPPSPDAFIPGTESQFERPAHRLAALR